MGVAGLAAVGAGRGAVAVAGIWVGRGTVAVGITAAGVDVTTAIGVPAGWRALVVGEGWAGADPAPEAFGTVVATGFVAGRLVTVGDGEARPSTTAPFGFAVAGMTVAMGEAAAVGEGSRVAVNWAIAVGEAAVTNPDAWVSGGVRRGGVSILAHAARASQLEVTDREEASVEAVTSRETS